MWKGTDVVERGKRKGELVCSVGDKEPCAFSFVTQIIDATFKSRESEMGVDSKARATRTSRLKGKETKVEEEGEEDVRTRALHRSCAGWNLLFLSPSCRTGSVQGRKQVITS